MQPLRKQTAMQKHQATMVAGETSQLRFQFHDQMRRLAFVQRRDSVHATNKHDPFTGWREWRLDHHRKNMRQALAFLGTKSDVLVDSSLFVPTLNTGGANSMSLWEHKANDPANNARMREVVKDMPATTLPKRT